MGVNVRVCMFDLTNGVMWSNIDPIYWLSKLYICYMATVVHILNGCGLGIDTYHGNQPDKSKLALCKTLVRCNCQLYLSTKTERFNYKTRKTLSKLACCKVCLCFLL